MIEETIKKIIEELKKQISNLENEKRKTLDFEELLGLSRTELTTKLAEYEIDDLSSLIFNIEKYQELLTISQYVANTLENNKKAIKNYIDKINNKIEFQNKELEDKIQKLVELLNAFISIYEYLYTDKRNISSENLFALLEVIKNYSLMEGLVLEITTQVCNKMLSEQHELTKEDTKIEEELNTETTVFEIEQFESNLGEVIEEVTTEVERTQEQAIISEPEKSLSEYRKEKIRYATGMYSRFFNARSIDNLGYSVSYCEDPTSLEEIENIVKEEGMSKVCFAIIILKIILIIKDPNLSDEEIKPYIEKFDQYIDIYNNSKKNILNLTQEIENINTYFEKLLELSKMGEYVAKVSEINKKMYELQAYVEKTQEYLSDNIIQENDYQRIKNEINELYTMIEEFISNIIGEKYIQIAKKESIKISSFILFARDSENIPYILSDLFGSTRSLIDVSALKDSKEDQNYQYKISELITHLFKYSMPLALASSESSNSNYKSKILAQICFLASNGKPDTEKPTDMWRFRPTRNSVIRFSEREIVIPNDTKLFNQVTTIIKKIVPNFEISTEKRFSLIVNIGLAIKRSDKELYQASIKRYHDIGIKILELFYKNGKYIQRGGVGTPELKTEFTQEECAIFEEYIKSTLEVLDEMNKKDGEYSFHSLFTNGGDAHEL